MAMKKKSGARPGDPRQLWLDLGMGPTLPPAPPPPPPPPPPPRGRGPDKLFFATLPPEDTTFLVSDLTVDLRFQNDLEGRPRPPRVLHVTLYGVGEYAELSPEILGLIKRGADSIELPQFDVTFDRALSFRRAAGDHPFVLCSGSGTEALTTLHDAFEPAMRAVGLHYKGPRLPFTPHMTLLYDRKVVPETELEEPITMPVRDFALVHSLHGRSLYHVLGRWPLRG